MTLEEASHQFKIPLEYLKAMMVEGLLSEPLHHQEIKNLSFLPSALVELKRYNYRKSIKNDNKNI